MASRSLHPSAILPPVHVTATRNAMIEYFTTAPWQSRRYGLLSEDKRLMRLAQERAYHIASTGEYEHYQESEDGTYRLWPNQMLHDAGYRLPEWWELGANYIESLAVGYLSALEALDALYASPAHQQHVAGLGWWADHRAFGCGFSAENKRRVYVVITAPPEPSEVFLPHISKPLVREE